MRKTKIQNISIQKLRRLPRAGIIYAIKSEDIIAINPHPLTNTKIKNLNSNNNKAISHQLSETSWNSSDSDETAITSSGNKSDHINGKRSKSSTSDNFMEHLFIESSNKRKSRNKNPVNSNQNSLIVQRGSFGINVPSDGPTESSDTNEKIPLTNKIEKFKPINGNLETRGKHYKKRNGKNMSPTKLNRRSIGKSKSQTSSTLFNNLENVKRNDHNVNREVSILGNDSQISPTISDFRKSKINENHSKPISKVDSQISQPVSEFRNSKEPKKSEYHSKPMSNFDSHISPPISEFRNSKETKKSEYHSNPIYNLDSYISPPFPEFRNSKETKKPENHPKPMSNLDSQITAPISEFRNSKETKESENHSKPMSKINTKISPPFSGFRSSKEIKKLENHTKQMSRSDPKNSTLDFKSRKPLLERNEKECDDYSVSSDEIYEERANDDLLTRYQDVSMELSKLKLKYNELILENSTVKQISENLLIETENLKYENSNVKTRNETLAAKNLENQNLSRIIENLNRKMKELCMQIENFQTKDSLKTRRLMELETNLIEFQEKSSTCKIDMEHLRNQLVQKDLELKRLTHNQKVDEKKDLQMKLIHNELIELRGNIRVLCRIKPEPHSLIQIINNETLQLPPQRCKSFCPIYNFNRVFKTTSTQSEVFSEVRQLITSFVDGYNVNMITYGQSGSGKTFTMIGTKEQPGIVTHSIREVFKLCNQRTSWCFKICLSVLEIYNETIFDLLTTGENPKPIWRKRTQIHDDGKCIHIKGLSEIEIKHEEELMNYVLRSGKNRSSCMTTLNNDSSRSHFIVMLRIHGKNTFQNCSSQGVLMLCDLAGSENCTSSLSESSMTESKYISKSLTVLGRVFEALYNKLLVIPFRDSKLTHILKPSLTGDAKFAFIVTLSGKTENLNNTVRVLNLARKVSQISLGQPRKNTINAVGKAIGRAELLCQSG